MSCDYMYISIVGYWECIDSILEETSEENNFNSRTERSKCVNVFAPQLSKY